MGTGSLKYQRVLLKLSGEALMGDDAYGINTETVARIAKEVKAAHASGLELCLVIGGGNIFRGIAGAAQGMDRAQADYMGMLATVMNALAMQGALQGLGVPATVMSAIPMELVCEAYNRAHALDHLASGRVVIFAAGTGNPFFTTDTGAALRACEMDCDALLKGTQVDGVYSADPKTNPEAERFEQVSYTKVLTDDLKVMDATAIALARENNLPILVFDLGSSGGLGDVVAGKGRYTYVGNPAG